MMPPMSDHDTWNMFFAAVVTGWSAHFGYLDGESIELCAKDADALLAESKKRETPDDDGWIKWKGGECPVPDGTIVDVQYRSGSRNAREVASSNGDADGSAAGAFWHNDDSRADIVAYRIVSEAGATK